MISFSNKQRKLRHGNWYSSLPLPFSFDKLIALEQTRYGAVVCMILKRTAQSNQLYGDRDLKLLAIQLCICPSNHLKIKELQLPLVISCKFILICVDQ